MFVSLTKLQRFIARVHKFNLLAIIILIGCQIRMSGAAGLLSKRPRGISAHLYEKFEPFVLETKAVRVLQLIDIFFFYF